MIVTIVTFRLRHPTTLAEITKTFQGTAPRYQGIPGLLRKNYWMSEDGQRAGGIYVWQSRADADRDEEIAPAQIVGAQPDHAAQEPVRHEARRQQPARHDDDAHYESRDHRVSDAGDPREEFARQIGRAHV